MIIGILETDSVDDGVENHYGSYADMFKRLFAKIDNSITYKVYQAHNYSLPEVTNECDAYLITGSKSSVYDADDWIGELKTFIRQLNQEKKKLIGICFGHQIIAEALGGHVKKSKKGWGVGLMTSTVLRHKSWMDPKMTTFDLLVSHQDQVINLPEEAILIVTNEFCKNSGFMIEDHFLTFQGHPEYEPGYLIHLMDKRVKAIGEERIVMAKHTLVKEADGGLVAGWIVGFINDRR